MERDLGLVVFRKPNLVPPCPRGRRPYLGMESALPCVQFVLHFSTLALTLQVEVPITSGELLDVSEQSKMRSLSRLFYRNRGTRFPGTTLRWMGMSWRSCL